MESELIIPKHIGIIMDGNRRFAKKLGEVATKGHEYGAERIEDALEWCKELGIKNLTLWAFSTENFKRPKDEVDIIFSLIKKFCRKFVESERVQQYKVRLKIIGNKWLFPPDVQQALEETEEATKDYDGFFLNIAAGYGGKQEILDATRRIAELVEKGEIKASGVSQELIEAQMCSASLPEVDLVIRTSGEQRTSGFLLWKTDYAEYYFSDKYWPEFDREELIRALTDFSERKRRFGK
jgi:tritrans,polycis-undecaprenyl-diphosphate synthase [geranylgeranyl-diphosphate specific]